MPKILLVLLLLFSSLPSKASSYDLELATASSIIILADWATTRNMSRQYHTGIKEEGLVLSSIFGQTPNKHEIDTYFVARLFAHYLAYKYLDNRYKNIYYTFTIMDHGSAVHNNLSLGLKIKF